MAGRKGGAYAADCVYRRYTNVDGTVLYGRVCSVRVQQRYHSEVDGERGKCNK